MQSRFSTLRAYSVTAEMVADSTERPTGPHLRVRFLFYRKSSKNWQSTFAVKHLGEVVAKAKKFDDGPIYDKPKGNTQKANGYKNIVILHYKFINEEHPYLNFVAKLTIGINKKTALYITSRPSDLECVRLHAAKIQRFFDFATFSSKKSEKNLREMEKLVSLQRQK